MRLLHTSDWHLGRSLHRADLGPAQESFLDHLVGVVRDERIDLVAVAGDVYDRAIPPLEAVELCADALVRLRDAGAQVVLISGNHDSARRLGFGSRLLDASGVHIRTRVAACAKPLLISDSDGPVAVYAIPYLEPDAVRDELPEPAGDGTLGRGHAAVLGRATTVARADAAVRGHPRSVLLAHGWVHGGTVSDSERDISVGGVGAVPAALFDGFSYVALGHLHGPQVLSEQLRYSGSPLPFSFSEASHRKGSWLVELDAAGKVSAEQVPAPVYRQLAVLRGPLEELLTSSAHTRHEADFVAVVVTDAVRPTAAMDRVRLRFPHVLTLTFSPDGVPVDPRSYVARTRGQSDLEIAAGFVEHVRTTPPTAGELALLREAFQGCRAAAAESSTGERSGPGRPAAEAPATTGETAAFETEVA